MLTIIFSILTINNIIASEFFPGAPDRKKKAQIRSRVEHPFHLIKNLFHYRKTRYRGLEKNTHRLQILFGL
jgi:hypothetical protein